eukprot:TRINITY_DN1629_c2_g1_i2.p1 TRINITY_DN1629_c2_g1~~TRINITY_DN1629_c2_g1_i2.p1  ORF type:complete len:131 (-),score=42.73 TRINITY_DN1629_c2_g1_i2:356-691(-)
MGDAIRNLRIDVSRLEDTCKGEIKELKNSADIIRSLIFGKQTREDEKMRRRIDKLEFQTSYKKNSTKEIEKLQSELQSIDPNFEKLPSVAWNLRLRTGRRCPLNGNTPRNN